MDTFLSENAFIVALLDEHELLNNVVVVSCKEAEAADLLRNLSENRMSYGHSVESWGTSSQLVHYCQRIFSCLP